MTSQAGSTTRQINGRKTETLSNLATTKIVALLHAADKTASRRPLPFSGVSDGTLLE